MVGDDYVPRPTAHVGRRTSDDYIEYVRTLPTLLLAVRNTEVLYHLK